MPVTPVTDSLTKEHVFVDNEMQDAIKKSTLICRLKQAGLEKRSGDSIDQIVFCLLTWPLLSLESLSAFCGRFIGSYLRGGIGVLYDFCKRQDINWRKHASRTSVEICRKHDLMSGSETSFSVDDSIKIRRGKRVEGASSHWDHTSQRHVIGQQVVQLVLCNGKGTIPVDQHIYVSDKKVQGLNDDFKDKRSAVALDYKEAMEKSKNSLFRSMLKRAVRNGFRARHVLGDSWYGNKENIEAVLTLNMIAIFMMQRGNMKYRFQGQLYTATMLYELVKRRMKAAKGQRFLTYGLVVEMNLESCPGQSARWRKVKLIFSKERRCSAKSWVVLLSTNIDYSCGEILKTYALRWGIEVYFKEVKQNMGFLKEQTSSYAVHYASIHLTALRYMLLYSLMLDSGECNFAAHRKKLSRNLEFVSYGAVLWELFKAIISGVIDSFIEMIGPRTVELIKQKIESTVDTLLINVLQLDQRSIEADLKAESMGRMECA